MTQEEKAKAYDKALERGRKVCLDCTDAERKVVDYIFPELAESEDEKILKRIKSIVESYLESQYKREILAWIEKQGEKKNTEHSFLQDAFDRSKKYTLDEKKEASEYSESILPTSIEYGESEEEYKLHTIIEAAFIAGQRKLKPTDYGNSIYCRQVEHKSVDWSEEDEAMRIKTLHYLSTRCSVQEYEEIEDWLKSLKERMKGE